MAETGENQSNTEVEESFEKLGTAVENLGNTVKGALDTPEEREKLKNAAVKTATDTAESATKGLTNLLNSTADGIDGLAKGKDIDYDKLKKAFETDGESGVMTYLSAAGLVLGGGVPGMVSMALRTGGVAGLFTKLTGSDPEGKKKEDKDKPKDIVSALKQGGIGGAWTFIMDEILGIRDVISDGLSFVKNIPGKIGDTLSNLLNKALSMFDSFMPSLSFFGDKVAGTDTGNDAAPEQTQRHVAKNTPKASPPPLQNEFAKKAYAEQQQLASHLLDEYGKKLQPYAETLADAGINISSTDTLVASLKNPKAQSNLFEFAKMAGTQDVVKSYLDQFNALQNTIDEAQATRVASADTNAVPAPTG